jgi:hypothetical protein
MEEIGQWPTSHKLGGHLAPTDQGDQPLQWPALAPEVNHDIAIRANHRQILGLDGASFFGRFAKGFEVVHLGVSPGAIGRRTFKRTVPQAQEHQRGQKCQSQC